jgi:cytochrome c oxidase assembly factor 1
LFECDLLVYGTSNNSKFELQVSAGCQIQAAQTIFQSPTADLSIQPYIFLHPIMSGMRVTGSMLSLARVMTLNTSAQSTRFMASLPRRDRRTLPQIAPRRTPLLVGAGVVGVSLWIGGLSYAMNYQRQSSSVVHGTLFTVRYDPRVQELLGDNIGYADSWAWIDGSVNHLKGQVNIKFDIKGSNGKKVKRGAHRFLMKAFFNLS